MCDPDNTLYREFLHWKAEQADRGIVSSTAYDEWLEMRNNYRRKA